MQPEPATIFSNSHNKIFRRTGILACSSIFLLFILGGLVRVTGSGMGCPDWPKCFGLYLPPTCSCQLPVNYHQLFLEKRIAKVNKFASILEKIGLDEKAKTLKQDKAILKYEEFNAVKAWIEYINRIFGVLAGIFVLFFFFFSILYKMQRFIIGFAFLTLFFLVLNAWIGSIVVATNLLSGIVSTHFLLSFLSIFCCMIALNRQKGFERFGAIKGNNIHWGVLFCLVLIEVFLGTLAREKSEVLQISGVLKGENGMMDLAAMGYEFLAHRFLPGFIFLYSFFLYWTNRLINYKESKAFFIVVLIAFIQIALGAVNVVWILPPWSQIFHIVFGSLLPVVVFYFFISKGQVVPVTKTQTI